MSPPPRISVVIAAWNVEPYLAETLESVRAQTVAPAEVVVVDDGSADATAAIAEAAPGVRVVRQANQGFGAARNAGAEAAAGDWLLFLDADDVLEPTAIERLTEVAARTPSPAAVVPNFVRQGADAGTLGWAAEPAERTLARRNLGWMVTRNRLQNNALVRRDVWAAHRYTERSERDVVVDLDFWLRILLAGETILRLGEPLVRVRTGRPGAQSGGVRTMRERRRRTFASLLRRPGLTAAERGLLAYQVTRTSVGATVARRTEARPAGTRERAAVLQVVLDEPGGGRPHVALLKDALEHEVEWREYLARPEGFGGWNASIRAVRREGAGCALIHAHGTRAAAAAYPAARSLGIPLVVTVHGLHLIRRSPGPISRAMTRRVLRRADLVLALSVTDRRDIERWELAAPGRVRSIRATFRRRDIPAREEARRALGLPPDAFVALWMGRLDHQKAPEVFLEALAAADASVAGLMIGDGPLGADVRRMVDERGLGGRIVLPGWVDDPAAAIGAADVFVGTSRWEGLAMAPLEAGAAGRALILNDAPGYADLAYRGIPGIAVPEGRPELIGAALSDLAANPERLRSLAAGTAEAVEREYPPEGLGEDVLAAYREVMGSSGPPR